MMIYNAYISNPSQTRWRCKTINRGLITGQAHLPTSIRRVNTHTLLTNIDLTNIVPTLVHHESTRGIVRGASDVQRQSERMG